MILRILGAAVLLALLGAAPVHADETRNADATLVWDITRQCFRPRSQPEAECGVRWNADTRRFAAPHQTATPAPATELDKVLAEEMSNVRTLRRNAGVEQMRGAAAALESMIDTPGRSRPHHCNDPERSAAPRSTAAGHDCMIGVLFRWNSG